MNSGGERAAVAAVLLSGAVIGAVAGTWLGRYGRGTSGTAVDGVVPSIATTEASSIGTDPPPSPTFASPSASSTAPPVASSLLSLEGDKDEISEPFDVRSGWQIQWQTDGSAFAFSVTGEANLKNVVDQPGPASGVTSVPVGGTFRIEVTAKGPWKITVRQPPT